MLLVRVVKIITVQGEFVYGLHKNQGRS